MEEDRIEVEVDPCEENENTVKGNGADNRERMSLWKAEKKEEEMQQTRKMI